MLKLIAVKALLILPLTSCMTLIATPNTFNTTIETEPVRAVCHVISPTEGEYIYLFGEHRRTAAVTVDTPVNLALDWSAESFEIMCEADGYHKATATVKPRLSWWMLLNAAFLKGMPFAVATDLATGAAWQYPGSVTIELEPTEAVTDLPVMGEMLFLPPHPFSLATPGLDPKQTLERRMIHASEHLFHHGVVVR
jgi:hypothetical protein